MAPTLVATLGGSTSNSYVDLTFADAYANNVQWGATWLALTEDARNLALITSTTWLETLEWPGERCTPATDNTALSQRLAWPRSDVTCDGITAACTAIPYEVQTATVELAYQFSQEPDLMLDSTGGKDAQVRRQKLDVLEVEYFMNASSASSKGGDLYSQVPWLKNWLGCWAGGQPGQFRVYRN